MIGKIEGNQIVPTYNPSNQLLINTKKKYISGCWKGGRVRVGFETQTTGDNQ